jgi:hypothetical protein
LSANSLPRPSAALAGALPELDRLLSQVSNALIPAIGHSYEARDSHGTGDGYVEMMWMFLKSFTFAVKAARAGHVGNATAMHEALHEVDVNARSAAGNARDLRAAAAGPAELAAMDTSSIHVGWDLGDAYVDRLTARVCAYFEETDTQIKDDLTITMTDTKGMPVIGWKGRHGPLAMNGRTHLDLAAAAEAIAVVYDRYLRDTAVQDALHIDPADPR